MPLGLKFSPPHLKCIKKNVHMKVTMHPNTHGEIFFFLVKRENSLN